MHSLTADFSVRKGEVCGQNIAVEVDKVVVFQADQRLDQSVGPPALRRAMATKMRRLWIDKCLASASPTIAHIILPGVRQPDGIAISTEYNALQQQARRPEQVVRLLSTEHNALQQQARRSELLILRYQMAKSAGRILP